MEMLIMRGATTIILCHNTLAVPRIGETIEASGVKLKIKDVIWHINTTTWVEVQV